MTRAVRRGVVALIASIALYAVADLLIKTLSGRLPVPQLVFFRSAFGVLPPVAMVLLRGRRRDLATRRLGAHLGRAALGAVTLVAIFGSFKWMPMVQAYALNFTSPLMLVALGALLMNERPGLRRWVATWIGFGGVLLVLEPQGGISAPGLIAGILGALGNSLGILWVRALTRTETDAACAFYFGLGTAMLSACWLPWYWTAPRPEDWPLLLGVGLAGGAGQLLFVAAARLLEASTMAPFKYTALVWATAFDWFFFETKSGAVTWVGLAVVVAAGLAVIEKAQPEAAPASG